MVACMRTGFRARLSRPLRRFSSTGPSVVLLTSSLGAVLFLGFAAEGDTQAAQVPLLFFALPVVLCGIAFGLRGGLVVAIASSGLIVYGSELSRVGLVSRAVLLVLLGSVVGVFADERRRLVNRIDRENELSLDLIATASFDGFFTRLNPAATRILGYSREKLMSRPFLEFVHPDDRNGTATEAARLAESDGELINIQNRMCHADGSVRWLEWNIRADASARSFIAVGRDVSARKDGERRQAQGARELALALEDARESNLRLNLVAEAVFDALVTVDADGTIVKFNTSAEQMFGYARDEVVGVSSHILAEDAEQDGYLDRYLRTGDEGIIGVRHEGFGRRKDGSIFPIEFTLGEVSRRGERLFVGVFRDITERKRRDEAALHFKDILQLTVQERTAELRELTSELDEARLETLRKLALAAEYRDDQTFEHAERVGMIAALLGELLGLTALEVDLIRQAAPLHDIGKLAVSDTILLKRGKLTPEQWHQMRSHTTAGHEILVGSNSDVLSLAAEIALSHHEWWDGSGYPCGLDGEQIPLSGRIVALADVFDSLCHERPYKRAWPVERAVAEIQRLSGKQLDPAVVDAFEQLKPYELLERPTALPVVSPARA
jgi:PAS domain S-box-containing protein